MVLRIGIVKPTFTAAAYSGYFNYSTGYYAFFYSPHLNHRPSAANADYYNYLPYPPEGDKDPIAKGGNDSIAQAGKLGKKRSSQLLTI